MTPRLKNAIICNSSLCALKSCHFKPSKYLTQSVEKKKQGWGLAEEIHQPKSSRFQSSNPFSMWAYSCFFNDSSVFMSCWALPI